ncbi:MAG: glycosyltransferase family 2 protein [Patescibacteria group bacterium]
MKPTKMPDLSIIIVNHNTRELLSACLRSIEQSIQESDRREVIVVDNASSDGSPEAISNFKIIRNKENRGFSAANNQGVAASKGRYVLLLNSDTEIGPGVLDKLVHYMDEHIDVGALTCLLQLSDGSMDPACHRGFPSPWASLTYFFGLEKFFPASRIFGQYHQGYKSMGEIHDVDCISGAFFLVRREVIEHVGLLDEAFFMYGEDIDWCFRIRKAGWKIQFYPHVCILHKKHQSGLAHANDELRRETRKHFYGAMKLFYNKHYRKRYSPLVSSLVLFGIKLRSFL